MWWPYCHRLHTGPAACLLVTVTSNVPGLPGRCSNYQCSRLLLPVTKQLVCQSLRRKSNTSLWYLTCRKLWAWQEQSLVYKFSYGEMQLQHRTDNCQLTCIMFEILTILMLKVQLKCDTMSMGKKFLMFQRIFIFREGTMILWNIRNYLCHDMSSQVRGAEPSVQWCMVQITISKTMNILVPTPVARHIKS